MRTPLLTITVFFKTPIEHVRLEAYFRAFAPETRFQAALEPLFTMPVNNY